MGEKKDAAVAMKGMKEWWTEKGWSDVEEMFFSAVDLGRKYRYFYDTLHRVCIELTSSLPTAYGDFFSQLQAVCRLTNYPLHRVDSFRWRARKVSHNGMEVDEQTYLIDVRAFADALAHFTDSPVPARLLAQLPQDVQHLPADRKQIEWLHRQKRMRFATVELKDSYIICICKELPADEPCKVDFTTNAHTILAAQLLKEGMQFNALSYTVDAQGVFHPQYIVVEPDYLLDITSITGCLKAYGDSAFNYLISKLTPNASTVHTLLGDFANQFLDDAFNLPNPEYRSSMQKAFNDRIIDICACDAIDESFFETTQKQFQNILKTVASIYELPLLKGKEFNIQLEPSFFCEALGVQGRMDCLIDVANEEKKFLIELKSGKWDEWRSSAREEHLMQMLLYKEVLYYNMNVRQADVQGNLLYSRYPILQEQRSFQDIVFHAINIRNNIVCMERGLLNGEARKWLPRLTPEALRRNASCSDKFWLQYCLPELQEVLDALHGMDALTAEYFHTFLQFLEREQFEGKMGDSRPDSTRAMSSLWNADINAKIENGDIFLDLAIVDLRMGDGVDAVCLEKQSCKDTLALPNFRIGDSVILYRRNSDDDSAVTQQVVRCNVEQYEGDRIWLKLKYAQRNVDVFDRTSLFAIEHDHVEATARALYAGLFSLVTADSRRRELLLCQREAEVDSSLTLTCHYLNEQIDDIVLRAKQAKDVFLLMGPPGTGKTSVALKSMVEEFLASGEDILLLSYTNRAVDEICEMLATIEPAVDYIRLGRELSCAPQHQSHLVANTLGKLANRKQVVNRIGETRVFVSTVASMSSHASLFSLKRFGVVIFDEASQILEPQILGILTNPAVGKFVMIGDHKQLPAVVVQSEELSAVTAPILNEIGLTNCRNSLFERLYEQNIHNDSIIAMLDHQGRMHPDICNFASQAFYEGKLLPVGLPHQNEPLPYVSYDESNDVQSVIATRRVAFFDVQLPTVEERQPKANVLEAKKIAEIVRNVILLCESNGIDFNPARQIGVIVPFRRQIALVRSEVEKVLGEPCDMVIDTVERYQGSQRDVIIYGTTITQRYELDILSNIVASATGDVDRKLNVAITRARKQLFILGNAGLLSANPLYRQFLASIRGGSE